MTKLTEKWTEKTLTNEDGTQLSIRLSLSDSDVIEIRSDDEEVFWLDKQDAETLSNAILQMAGVLYE